MNGKAVEWISRLLLAGVFLWSGITSLLEQLASPGHWTFFLIPSLEILTALIVLIATWRVLFLIFGAYFITSGILKLGALQAFTQAIGNYAPAFAGDYWKSFRSLMEEPKDAYVAYSLPWLEIFTGAMVIIGFGRRLSLVVLMGLLMFFNFLIAMAMFQGLNINCGCFAEDSKPTNYPLKLAVNTGLWIIAALLLIFDFRLARFRSAEANGSDA